jgi:hypothetical protein
MSARKPRAPAPRGPRPRSSRRPRSHGRVVGATLGLAAVLAIALGVLATRGGTASSALPTLPAGPLPGELADDAPWPANVGQLAARLSAIRLPALLQEGTALHIHQHLDVYVDGRHVTVPAGIGIDVGSGFISPLHTHDATGVMHVESPDVRTFTLGQFFAVWGVRLTRRCLGGYCASGPSQVRVFVDGHRFKGDPRQVALAEHQEIVVAYGTPAQLPKFIPQSYDFPAGL